MAKQLKKNISNTRSNFYSCSIGNITFTVESSEHSLRTIRKMVLEDVAQIMNNENEEEEDGEPEHADENKFKVPDMNHKDLKVNVKHDVMFS